MQTCISMFMGLRTHGPRYLRIYAMLNILCILSIVHTNRSMCITCACKYVCVVLCSGKIWRALNLANRSPESFGEFQIRRITDRAHVMWHILYYLVLVGISFGDFPQLRQFVKLKTSPKFPAIRYIYSIVQVNTGSMCIQVCMCCTYYFI